MYYLYVRGGSRRHPGNDHWTLIGVFPPSDYWTDAWNMAKDKYGEDNITTRWHFKTQKTVESNRPWTSDHWM